MSAQGIKVKKVASRSRSASRGAPPRGNPAATADNAPPAAGFSVLVGELPALLRAIAIWDTLIEGPGPAVPIYSGPDVLSFPHDPEVSAEGAVRVAVVRHAPEEAERLTRRVQDAMVRLGVTGVLVEPGYFFTLAHAEPHAVDKTELEQDAWVLRWNSDHHEALLAQRPINLPPAALGVRWIDRWKAPRQVVVLDTGDQWAKLQWRFTGDSPPEQEDPSDHYGHGTAVGTLIRTLAPGTRIKLYRTYDPPAPRAESLALLNALSAAVNSVEVSVVCIPQYAEISYGTQSYAGALELIINQREREGQQTPIVVCAAGNFGRNAPMPYPAKVRGILVGRALDRRGKLAEYNCSPPLDTSIHVIDAFGGSYDDPLGWCGRPRIADKRLWGTSFVAANIAAAIAAGDCR